MSRRMQDVLDVVVEVGANYVLPRGVGDVGTARADVEKELASRQGKGHRTVQRHLVKGLGLPGVGEFDSLLFAWLHDETESLESTVERACKTAAERHLVIGTFREIAGEGDGAADEQDLAPRNLQERRIRALLVRQGQPRFRSAVLRAYARRCAVTGANAEEALEAAHIEPYRDGGSQDVRNGLLLRADVHSLFDLGCWAVEPDSLRIRLAPSLRRTSYGEFEGRILRLPEDLELRPVPQSFGHRWRELRASNPRLG